MTQRNTQLQASLHDAVSMYESRLVAYKKIEEKLNQELSNEKNKNNLLIQEKQNLTKLVTQHNENVSIEY